MKSKKHVEEVLFNGTCRDFSLKLVQDWLLKRGRWSAEDAMAMADKLSKDVKKTINDFFKNQPKTAPTAVEKALNRRN